MAKDNKKLHALYEEYKKIRSPQKMSEGGKPHSQQNLKQLDKAFHTFITEESKEKGYDDGGQVQQEPSFIDKLKNYVSSQTPDPYQNLANKGISAQDLSKGVQQNFADGGEVENGDSFLSDLGKAVRKSLGSPEPTPKPSPTPQEDKYAKIRARNASNATGETSEQTQPYYSKGGKVKGYADGTSEPIPDPTTGDIDPNSPEGLKMIENAESYPQPDVIPEDREAIEGGPQLVGPDAAKEKDLEDLDVDKASVEEPYRNEELASETKADNKSPDRDVASEKDADEEDLDEEPVIEASEDGKEPINISKIKTPSDQLADAQAARADNIRAQGLLRGSALIGAGIARSNPAQALQTISEGDKYVGLPVQEYQEKIANAPNDPNSTTSQVMRDYMNSKGFKVPPETSATDLYKVAPFLKNDATLNVKLKLASDKLKAQQEEKEKDRQAAMDRTDKQVQGHIAAAKAGQEAKLGKEQRDSTVKMENDILNARSKPALQIAYRNSIAIKNLQKMEKEFPDFDKYTPQQVNLYNLELAKIASGNAPTEGMVHDLQNPTAASSLAGIMQKISNVPVGAQQGKFLKLNKQYLQGLADVSNQVIKDNMGNQLKAYQDKVGPDQYKNALYRHSDMLGIYTPQQEQGITAVQKAKGLSRQDAIKALVQQKLIPDVNY